MYITYNNVTLKQSHEQLKKTSQCIHSSENLLTKLSKHKKIFNCHNPVCFTIYFTKKRLINGHFKNKHATKIKSNYIN